jgi:hypothetical protein
MIKLRLICPASCFAFFSQTLNIFGEPQYLGLHKVISIAILVKYCIASDLFGVCTPSEKNPDSATGLCNGTKLLTTKVTVCFGGHSSHKDGIETSWSVFPASCSTRRVVCGLLLCSGGDGK